ncbi:MAG: GntR family transcriptional regulator [Pirellulaceae bacterium]|nr:GntR family transcriptional regulator [Pirellulaceae bacterium]
MSENLSQRAYWYLHDKLASGDLQPGHRLSNRAVAGQIGISFTPVREAFNRLVSEGLLEYREGLGVLVPQPSQEEIKELYEVREMLECAAISRFAGRLANATLAEMRRFDARMREIVELAEVAGRMGKHGERFRVLDSAFHLALIRGTGNRQLIETLSDLKKKCEIKSGGASSRTELIGYVFHAESLESVQQTLREHGELIELLEQGERDEAAELMSRHIYASQRLALEAMNHAYMKSSRRASRAASLMTDVEETYGLHSQKGAEKRHP